MASSPSGQRSSWPWRVERRRRGSPGGGCPRGTARTSGSSSGREGLAVGVDPVLGVRPELGGQLAQQRRVVGPVVQPRRGDAPGMAPGASPRSTPHDVVLIEAATLAGAGSALVDRPGPARTRARPPAGAGGRLRAPWWGGTSGWVVGGQRLRSEGDTTQATDRRDHFGRSPRSSGGTWVTLRIAVAAAPRTPTTMPPIRKALSCHPAGSSGATAAVSSLTATARAVANVTTELRITVRRLWRSDSTAAPLVGPPGAGGDESGPGGWGSGGAPEVERLLCEPAAQPRRTPGRWAGPKIRYADTHPRAQRRRARGRPRRWAPPGGSAAAGASHHPDHDARGPSRREDRCGRRPPRDEAERRAMSRRIASPAPTRVMPAARTYGLNLVAITAWCQTIATPRA